MWTDNQIRSLEPRNTIYQISEDTRERGTGRLVLQIDPSGTKRFYYQYFINGSRKFVQIGKFRQRAGDPGYSLSEARKEKSRLADLHLREGDVKSYLENKSRKEEEERRAEEAQGTFEELVNCYIDDMSARGKRTADRVIKSIELYVYSPFPNLKTKRAKEITVDDIKTILRRMVQKGIKAQTNKIRAHLHAIFQYGLHHDHDYEFDQQTVLFNIQFNPVAATQRKQHFDGVGQHVVSEKDLYKFWHLSEKNMHPISEIALKLAFATGGQRPGELLKCPWSAYDLDKKLLTIPAEVSKNGLVHVVPLNELACGLLEKLKPLTCHLEYPFAGQERNGFIDLPIRSDSLAKALKRFCDKHVDHEDNEQKMERFIPRDIRRTCKTLMGAAGVSKEIRDRLQNHAVRSDVSSKHYDRYDYLAEKWDVMRIWDEYLERVINPQQNVVNIQRR